MERSEIAAVPPAAGVRVRYSGLSNSPLLARQRSVMTERQTVAYPPGPSRNANPRTDATMFASPAATSATVMATPESSQATVFAGQTQGPGASTNSGRVTLGRGSITVLPDVRNEGEQLIIVPRDKTRYESNKLLGRGGMGEVKLAHDHDIGRKVAVKRLLDEDNPHAVARFIDEVRTVGSLEHPNIVPIHDVGVDEDGSLFFVMKYVEGETLASIIKKLAAGDREYHARYSFEARLDVFFGLLRALQYAHGQGLVHRDIKPENLMIGRYGEVVVMDWGIAHAIRGQTMAGKLTAGLSSADRASTETMDGAVVGTPQYMSPEQAAGDVAGLDGRSDLYSAFAVLYEFLTLQPYIPEGKSAMEVVLAVSQRQPPSPMDAAYRQTEIQDAVPVALRHFLRHGLQHDKQARYASAEEVIWEIERLRSGDCAVACPVTFMKHNNHKIERFMDRHPGSAMFMVSAAVVGFLGGMAGWLAWLVG
jgi:serine/threonine protein kinase